MSLLTLPTSLLLRYPIIIIIVIIIAIVVILWERIRNGMLSEVWEMAGGGGRSVGKYKLYYFHWDLLR